MNDDQPPSGGKLGDVIAAALGVGVVVFFVRADFDALAQSDETWLEVLVVAGGCLAVIAALTWTILRVWDYLRGNPR